MKKLLATLVLFLVAACVDNPLGLTEGMWVKHKVDGQKYFITYINRDTAANDGAGIVKVKNEFGVEVDKEFGIFEFDLWVDQNAPSSTQERKIGLIVKELIAARKAYEASPSPEAKERLGEAIEETEKSVTADSPVFAPKKWNPDTQKYE